MWLTLGSFSLSYKRQRYKRLSGPSSIIHTKKKKKKSQSFSHSFTLKLKDPQSFKKRGPLCIGVLQLCSEWLAELLTLCSSSWYVIAIPFLFLRHPFGFCLFFFFFFFLNTSFGFSFFLVWNSGPPSKAKWKSQNFSPLFSRYVTLSLSLCVG